MIELNDGGYRCRVFCDSVSPDGVRLTTLEATFPRIILAEYNTHRSFCLAGDAELYFDLPGDQKKGKKHIYTMRIDEFVDKWFDGANRIIANPKKKCDLSVIDPERFYSPKEVASLLKLKTQTNINAICNKGIIPAKKANDNRTWLILGSDIIAWRNSVPEHTRFGIKQRLAGMKLRCLNEDTGEFINTTIVDCCKSGSQDIFEIELDNGYKLKLTKKHKILTGDGWSTLEDLDLENHDGLISWKSGVTVATNGLSIKTILEEKEAGLSRTEIAEKYNVSLGQLGRFCEKNKIFFKRKILPNETFEYKNKEWLQARLDEGLFSPEIAELCNSTADRVKKSVKKLGLKGNKWTWGSTEQPWNKGKTYKFPEEKLINVRAAAQRRRKDDSYKDYKDLNAKSVRFLNEIRMKVLEKFNYKCQISGAGSYLQLHHIDPVWHNKDLAFDIDNIIPLNRDIHKFIHSNNLDLIFLEWVRAGKPLNQFMHEHQNLKIKCEEINKPKSPGNKLIVRYNKIKNIKYLGKEETYDIEVNGPYHNFIANGMVVHNSRNSASSRAIPVEKQIARIKENPFIPEYWGKNQKGMQADEEVSEEQRQQAKEKWLIARDAALTTAQALKDIGIHKQITNRLLEPFMWHTVLVTATEWSNFFALRCTPQAQPEIRKIACMMREAMERSVPKPINYGEWHLPLLLPEEVNTIGNCGGFEIEDAVKVSVGRCCRVSYLTHDGRRDIDADIKLANQLRTDGHFSPWEHVARPMTTEEAQHHYGVENSNGHPAKSFAGNFRGWVQARKELPNEDDFSKLTKDNDDTD